MTVLFHLELSLPILWYFINATAKRLGQYSLYLLLLLLPHGYSCGAIQAVAFSSKKDITAICHFFKVFMIFFLRRNLILWEDKRNKGTILSLQRAIEFQYFKFKGTFFVVQSSLKSKICSWIYSLIFYLDITATFQLFSVGRRICTKRSFTACN